MARRMRIAAAAAAILAWPAGASAQAPITCPAGGGGITQSFPTSGTAQTTWFICWREVAGNNSTANPNGLIIGPVYFRRAANAPYIRVLWDMRVSEYFVPYHSGSPRFYDLSFYNFKLTTVTAADCPASVGGALLSARVCRELRDRGLAWKDYSGVRRGEELVLWGVIDAANYRYIQEYTFRDDGVIIGRVGATAQNLPAAELEAHTHNAIWRLDIDLAGVINNAARVRHSESTAGTGAATDTSTAIATAQGFTTSVRRHDVVEVSNPTLKNKAGHVSSYHLVPLITAGLTQHIEKFTQNDFWVTPYSPAQFAAKDLTTYVAGSPSVANRDLVVWYKGSLHHKPRDEDGVFAPNNGPWTGTALVMWTGFMLMPHNLFDCTPLYKPCP
jgi:hypothetical protein